jgi:hypothetical protein
MGRGAIAAGLALSAVVGLTAKALGYPTNVEEVMTAQSSIFTA